MVNLVVAFLAAAFNMSIVIRRNYGNNDEQENYGFGLGYSNSSCFWEEIKQSFVQSVMTKLMICSWTVE